MGLEIIVNLGRFQHTRNRTALCHYGPLLLLRSPLSFFREQSRVILGTELLQLDQKVAQMSFESRQVHGSVKHPLDKLGHLNTCQVRKTRNQEIGDVIT